MEMKKNIRRIGLTFAIRSFAILLFAALIIEASATSRIEALKEIQSRHLIMVKLELDSSYYPVAKENWDIDPEKLEKWNVYVKKIDQANSIIEKNFAKEWKFNKNVSFMTYSQIESLPKNERINYAVLAVNHVNVVWDFNWDNPNWVIQRLSEEKLDVSRTQKCDYYFPLPYYEDARILFTEGEFILSMRMIQKQFSYSLERNFFCSCFFDYFGRELCDHATISCKYDYIVSEDYFKFKKKESTLDGTHLVLMKPDEITALVNSSPSDTTHVLLRFYADSQVRQRYEKEPFYPVWPASPAAAERGQYSAERANSHVPFSPDGTMQFLFVSVMVSTGEVFFVKSNVLEYISANFIMKYLMCK